ncbi:MAG: hypothetical protein JJE47_03985 [Acidimicrobiia bacterium]|nr:hypothetical protein [Acidimicrobiia bacterium]
MSDNDFTSGHPWGLGDPDTDSATEAAAPPAPQAHQDDLPDDLADLSTIEAQSASTIPGPLEESLSEAHPSNAAVDADLEFAPEAPSEDPIIPDESKGDQDLDLGDLGGFADFEGFSDSAETQASDTAESSDLVEGESGDLSALEIDPDQVGSAGASETDDSPVPSRRRLNPLLAASGLFGSSPTVPPRAMATGDDSSPVDAPDASETEPSSDAASSEEPLPAPPEIAGEGLEGAFGDLAADTSIDIPGLGASDAIFEDLPAPLEDISSSFGDLSAVDVPDIAAIQFDEGSVDFGSIELTGDADSLDDQGPIDMAFEDVESIEAELAETLQALGDQTADSITLDPSDVPTGDAHDFFPEFMTSIDAPVDDVAVEIEMAGMPANGPEMTTDPDVETHLNLDVPVDDEAEDEPESAPGDATLDISSDFAEPDFSTHTSPPSVYHELESLGDGETSETPESPESIFGAVLGGAPEGPDDPFAAIFGSGEAAIAAVAAAAAAIETEQPVRFTPGDSPTVDDLPDFLVDDEPHAEIGPSVAAPAESADDSPVESPAEVSSEVSDEVSAEDTDTDTSGEATEPAADADNGETRAGEAKDSEYVAVLTNEDNGADGVDAPQPDGETQADPGSVEINDDASPIPPLPPMQATTPSFDPDPFSSGHDSDLTKVDADDLKSTGDDPAAAVEAMFPSDVPMDFSPQTGAESNSPISTNPPAIVGTTTTGVSEKKPIPEDWGTRSDEAYEGWVQDDEGVETWRMIVTNLPTVSGYDIDEFLGLAVADSMVASHDVETVAIGRRAAIDALTEDGVLRGAHAIVAVAHAIQPVGDQILVTVSGTAVTLKPITAR